MEKEIRTLETRELIPKTSKRGRTIEGYAIVFNSESRDLGGFVEVIKPEAVQGVIEKSDILALLNHDEARGVLARSTNGEGTLQLVPDEVGVKYIFEAPETSLGDEVLSGVKRGDIRTSSFSFSVGTEGQQWEKRSDGKHLRTITKFDSLYDVSPVYREAYSDTSVAVRKLAELQNEIPPDLKEEIKEEKVEERAEEKKEEKLLEIVDDKKEEPKKPSFKELQEYYKEKTAQMLNLKNQK